MHASSRDAGTPRVSIILPTYNRAEFLPGAFDSIRGQHFANWELVVVDDGSTDNSCEIVARLIANWRSIGIQQSVNLIRQANLGAYGARNTGLDHATGNYIAFYDSDDLWLAHHLADCVQALDDNGDVDWVYGACRIVDHRNGRVLDENTFHANKRPRPFTNLRFVEKGALRIINDQRATECAIRHGLFNGLQNSVFRASLFASLRFGATARNEAEDQLLAIRALQRGRRIGYLDRVHVEYRIHNTNSSGSASEAPLAHRLRVQTAIIQGFEALLDESAWGRHVSAALRQRLAREWFWLLGYSLYWQHNRPHDAIHAFRRGISHWPWEWRMWKTYALCAARLVARRTPGRAS
jgi:glycosyltransferase involved in cell wall biosynthesis